MIADLKPYPAYKDSGVPWLGEVPEHWEVRRQRHVVEMRVSNIDKHSIEGEVPVRLCNYGDVYKNECITDCIRFMLATATPQEIERFRLRLGDVLITKDSEVWNDIGVPALVKYAAADLVSGYHLALLRPREHVMSGPYLLRVLQSEGVAYQYHIAANGVTRYGLSHTAIKRVLLPVAPLPEQAAIIRFLDHAGRRIRRYIRAKQKLIKLLNEQKQAIVHRAVTRGLDPNVRLKPSGVEWVGDVPRHWEVVRSGSVFRLFGGFAFPGTGFVRDESDEALPVLLTPVNFDPVGGLRFGSKSTVRFRGNMPEQFKLRKGALVTVLTDLSSKRLILGRAGFIEHDGVLLNQRTARVDIHTSTRSRLNAQYLCWVLNSRPVREQTISTSRGSTVFHTSPTRMLAARWPLPPLEEQHEIVERLETLERTQRVAYERLGYEIELLREYRTRLIADVVTGKLDVREAAARLPDEAEEPEPLDNAEALSEGANDTDEADLDAVPAEA